MRARAGEITHLTVDRGFTDKVRLHMGDLIQAMDAMNTCLDELLSHWGIDVEAHRHLSRVATPKDNPARWIHSNDYPGALLKAGFAGIVDFRLMVDESGKPTECIVQEASNPRDFADVTCKLLIRRAEFEPALDADGGPIKSYWSNRVRWVIPRR